MTRIICNLILAIVCGGLVACSSTPTKPAPVRTVGKDYSDYNRATIAGSQYKVQSGDTLFSIAWQTGQDYRKLAEINDIPKPYTIYKGQTLNLKTSPQKTPRLKQKPLVSNSSIATQKKVDDGHKKAIDSKPSQGYRQKQAGQKNGAIAQAEPTLTGKVVQWHWPTKGKLTSQFSASQTGSKGIDIEGQFGQAITAAAEGKVVYAGSGLRGYGELIIIKHSDDFLSAYAHNSSLRVAEGQWVKAGQLVANMGSTGTKKVMLHFEIRRKGQPVDPLRYLPSRGSI
ncbi:peptidoglycan DD-metalloendopeptidase family protein [Echinimonas agarilytica]|uniref:Peptidoglycan DD-metalloendopeptidase family protein n=1 Tax=Echinimonas agarilytica TaxID=1215918 RepID=A0AA41W4T8_9GAMM|nr:peptidoglycan DD-metalloendopeptidase family protein [Echinimonas agarilytica]MCM2678841.1 peptidoglycan DD-metalloendopeptidase family protein [Echinimonas agarilytica]